MPERGFDSFLQYGYMVAPGIMHLKAGAYLLGWLYQGPDIESSSIAEQEWQSFSHNNAQCRLGDGWMIHQIIVRAPSNEYPTGKFDEITNAMIDTERRIHFTDEGVHFETFPFIFLTYRPPSYAQGGLMSKIGRFLMGTSIDEGISQIDGDIKHINEVIQNFEMSLSQTMEMRRLTLTVTDDGIENDELLHALNLVINHKNHPCTLPNPPINLDSWLARDVENGEYFLYDGQYVSVISVDSFPPCSMPNMLAEIEHLPLDITWSNRIILTDEYYARSKIDSMRKMWQQKTTSMMSKLLNKPDARVDHYAVQMVAETEAASALVEQGAVGFGHYTSTILLRSDDTDELVRKKYRWCRSPSSGAALRYVLRRATLWRHLSAASPDMGGKTCANHISIL